MTGTVEDVTERIAAEAERARLGAELERRATYDSLTRVLNRASVMAGLEGALARQSAGPTAVIFVDLDHFKEVNDRLGHEAAISSSASWPTAWRAWCGQAMPWGAWARRVPHRVPGPCGANPACAWRSALLGRSTSRCAWRRPRSTCSQPRGGVRRTRHRQGGCARPTRRRRMYASKRDGRGQPVLYSSALARTQRAGDTVARAPGARSLSRTRIARRPLHGPSPCTGSWCPGVSTARSARTTLSVATRFLATLDWRRGIRATGLSPEPGPQGMASGAAPPIR